MKVITAYILYLVEETEDEVKEVVYGVFTDSNLANEQGKWLVKLSENNYIAYSVSDTTLFD
jgi:hypothetical protein